MFPFSPRRVWLCEAPSTRSRGYTGGQAALNESEKGCRGKKSSLSHSGSICPESPHLPLIPQDLPRRNLDEGGSGTAGVKLSKNLPPIRLSESRRAELCQKFRRSVNRKSKILATEEGRYRPCPTGNQRILANLLVESLRAGRAESQNRR